MTHFAAETDQNCLWGGVNREQTDTVQDIGQPVLKSVWNA